MESPEYREILYSLERRRRSKRRIDLLLRAYSLGGILIAILSGGVFLLTLLPFELSSTQSMALTMAGVGIAVAIMSRALALVRKERENQEVEALREYEGVAELLSAWSRLEEVSKAALDMDDRDVSRRSIRSVFERLRQEGKIDEADLAILEEALQTRNAIVHGGRPIPSAIAKRIADMLLDVIAKLTFP